MTINHFMRNWVLHYIQFPYLYLPGYKKDRKKVKTIIKPISYVHSNKYGYSFNTQYYYADFTKPIVTGTLDFEYAEDGKQKSRDQEPCKWRVYTYNEKIKKFCPIKEDGSFDEAISDDSLFENQQSLMLIPNLQYYYREEQASEGDVIHFDIESFYINDKEDIATTQEDYQNRIEIGKSEQDRNGNIYNQLTIRHYPKMVKVYAVFIEGEEKSTIVNNTDKNDLIDFTDHGYMGFINAKEDWANALCSPAYNSNNGNINVQPASLYKYFPKILKITYMEKELNLFPKFKDIKRENTQQKVVRQLARYLESAGGMFSGGTSAKVYYAAVNLPEKYCNPDIYINKVLIHHGDEAEWNETGNRSQYFTRDSVLHLFNKIEDGSGANERIAGWQSTCPYDRDAVNNFWYVNYPTDPFIVPQTSWIWTPWENGGRELTKVTPPWGYLQEEKTIKREGNLKQKIDENYTTELEKPIFKIKINGSKSIIKSHYIHRTNETTIDQESDNESIIRNMHCEAFGWCAIEDVAGMASWMMGEATKYDPDGSYSNPYICKGGGPDTGLRVAFGQYENSKTKDFTKDTFAFIESYDSNNPNFAVNSPLSRKYERARYDDDYRFYDEAKFEKYTTLCDQGCSTVISYIKTTRQGYRTFFNLKEPIDETNWLIKDNQ